MGNMSYCRFRNTSSDLTDCQETLMGMIDGEEGRLQYEELRAAKILVETCCAILRTVSEVEGIDLDDKDAFHYFERDYHSIIDKINENAPDR